MNWLVLPPNFSRNLRVTKVDPPSNGLLEKLGVNLATTSRRVSAALKALADEVVWLDDEVSELRAQLIDARNRADMDTLVAVYNRRAFERELSIKISSAERYDHALCLIFFDLDGFKAVNDRFGHVAGDEVLKAVGEMLSSSARDTDIVGRLGGDEFAIALTHSEFENCQAKASELSKQISSLVVKDTTDQASPTIAIGASYGVSEWASGKSAIDLIHQSDQAMYAMKADRQKLRQKK